MPAKSADRKKEAKAASNELAENLAAFVLPDSLPCSEVNFPVLIKRKAKANWKTILEESDIGFQKIKEYEDSKTDHPPKSPFLRTEAEYIKNEVFLQLLPALEETLIKAKLWNALENHKCFFNGIDHIVQLLWNNNPRHPYRQDKNLHLFNMPWVRLWLTNSPRSVYPKSWLWPEEHAATLIQKTFRQYLVQKDEEVQDMRDFWKKLEVEREVPEMDVNPFLSKRFASQRHLRKPSNLQNDGPSQPH